MARLKPLQRKALRDLRARWLSFAVGALLAALTTCLAVGTASAGSDVAASLDETYRRLKFQDLGLDLLAAPPAVVQEVAALPGVLAVEGRASTRAYLRSPSGEGDFTAQLYGVPGQRRPQVNDLAIAQGSYLTGAGELLMERRFARRHGYRVGDRVTLVRGAEQHRYRLVGLVSSPEFLWVATDRYDPIPTSDAILFLGERDLAALLGDASIDQLLIRTDRPGPTSAAIQTRLARYLKQPPFPRDLQPSHALLTRAQSILQLISAASFTAGLLLGSTILGLLLWRLVRSQRAQLGALLCLGFSGPQLAWHYVSMGLAVALAGAVPGALAGTGLAGLLLNFYAGLLGLPIVHYRPHPTWILASLLAVVGATLLATSLAVRPLVRLQPVEAMREEFAVHLWSFRRGPVWARLALRNLLRAPVRTLGSILALSLCVTVMTLALIVKNGQREALAFYFEKCVRYDLLVELAGIPSAASLPALTHWAGVERVEGVLRMRGWLATEKRATLTTLWGIPADCQLWGLYDPWGQRVSPPQADRLLGSRVLSTRLEVEPGRALTLWPVWPSEPGDRESRWRLGPALAEVVMNPAKVSLARLQAVLADRDDVPFDGLSCLLVKTSSGRAPAVRRRLLQLPEVTEVIDRAEVEHRAREALKVLGGVQLALQGLSWLITLTVVAAVATLNLEEQRHEMATLTVLGVEPRALLRFRLLEVSLLALAAWPTGLALGALLGRWLLAGVQRDLLQMPLSLDPTGLLGILASLLLLALLGTLAAWRLRHE